MSRSMPIKTRLIHVTPENQANAIAEAGEILRDGGLVAFGTETVYGLGADATNPAAVARIFEAKGRPSTNPLIVHVHELALAHSCVAHWPAVADDLAKRFWPGPLTLVLPRSGLIPDIVTGGGATVGVRMPALSFTRELIREAGTPIAAPSANRSNGVSPTHAAHVLCDLDGRIELILDTGPCPVGLESTVLDLTRDLPLLLRPGMLAKADLEQALQRPIERAAGVTDEAATMTSPGQLSLHYAPRTLTLRVAHSRLDAILDSAERGQRVAIMNLGHPAGSIEDRGVLRISYDSPEAAAHDLYARLRAWDDADLDAILILTPPEGDDWQAIGDRVRRATGPRAPGMPIHFAGLSSSSGSPDQ
jgi:L-threonylcarbamoyladenylate synthase